MSGACVSVAPRLRVSRCLRKLLHSYLRLVASLATDPIEHIMTWHARQGGTHALAKRFNREKSIDVRLAEKPALHRAVLRTMRPQGSCLDCLLSRDVEHEVDTSLYTR